MLEVKRREQLLALKNLAQLNDVHQQYKILDVMLKGLFKVCGQGHCTPQRRGGTDERAGVPKGTLIREAGAACTQEVRGG